ncbi:CASC3 [Sigmodon hispidus]
MLRVQRAALRLRARAATAGAEPVIVVHCWVESRGTKSAEEDGMEGDTVLSDYESAEDSEGAEREYSEEENSKVELKSEVNDAADSSAKEKGEEKSDIKGTVTGERQNGDG